MLALMLSVCAVGCQQPPQTLTQPTAVIPPLGSFAGSPQIVALGEAVSTNCDTRCPACAEGESLICRYFAVDAPHAGALRIRVDAQTDREVFVEVVTGPRSYASATSPLVMRQPVERGKVTFGRHSRCRRRAGPAPAAGHDRVGRQAE